MNIIKFIKTGQNPKFIISKENRKCLNNSSTKLSCHIKNFQGLPFSLHIFPKFNTFSSSSADLSNGSGIIAIRRRRRRTGAVLDKDI